MLDRSQLQVSMSGHKPQPVQTAQNEELELLYELDNMEKELDEKENALREAWGSFLYVKSLVQSRLDHYREAYNTIAQIKDEKKEMMEKVDLCHSYHETKRMIDSLKPVKAEEKPAESEEKPVESEEKPAESEERPVETDEKATGWISGLLGFIKSLF